MAHLTTDPSNPARWVCFYPIYIDANKTLPEGRRIPKEKVPRPPRPPLPVGGA